MDSGLSIATLPGRYAISRLEPDGPVPSWFPGKAELQSLTRTRDELSLVTEEEAVTADIKSEKGWRAFKVLGPLEFSLTGIMATLSSALAAEGISLFALSTYDTDYILVKEEDLEKAKVALSTVATLV